MPAPAVSFHVRVDDRLLNENIARMARAAGETVKERTRTTFKGMVKDALAYTPPGSQKAQGKDAQRVGQASISRDLFRMGFTPVEIKGHRTITKAFGHPIEPVTVSTKENPKFAEPDIFHAARMQSKHGGRVTRGGRQGFYVDRRKFKRMQTRLFAEIGKLASGWAPAADSLGVNVPAWIRRHVGSGRGSQVQLVETEAKLSMRVVNHFPETAGAEASQMQRLIDTFIRPAAIGRLKRDLEYRLKNNIRAAHRT